MADRKGEGQIAARDVRKPFSVRLPVLVFDGEVGLGDAAKRLTGYVGIQPCDGCEHRARVLNRWINFTARPGKRAREGS
jgi:hypothetical protein